MFDHPEFRKYAFNEVPLHRDIFLMDERWMAGHERANLRFFEGGEYENVGYISYAQVRNIGRESMEISWYPNLYDRFHEVTVTLPRAAFVTCVECHNYDEKPFLFVKSRDIMNLFLRSYSVFAVVDAIGVKDALRDGRLTRDGLVELRGRIGEIAGRYPDISFVSFADSLLLKSNWNVGTFDTKVDYTYDPEEVLRLILEIRDVYNEVLGMDAYAILTQGSNEYYDDTLLHISSTGNHVCLNSLGLPFAQLMSIDDAVRKAIKAGVHEPADLYLDEGIFHSLRFQFKFEKNDQPCNAYPSPMSSGRRVYYYSDVKTIFNNLDSVAD